MTMHLAHPALTLGGKRKGKHKFRNADEARKARELAEEWERNQAKWKAMCNPVPKTFTVKRVSIAPKAPIGRETVRIPSLNNGVDTGAATKPTQKVYTGTKIIGIGTMHKSNAVPIFSDEQAKDISTMRRG